MGLGLSVSVQYSSNFSKRINDLKNLTKAPKPDFWQHHFKKLRPNFLKLIAF